MTRTGWYASKGKTSFGADLWKCTCGHVEKSRILIDDHLTAHHKADAERAAADVKAERALSEQDRERNREALDLNELRLEFEAALQAARTEGRTEGYYVGLDVAYAAATEIHEAAGRWGPAEETATGMVCDEIDKLRKGRPDGV